MIDLQRAAEMWKAGMSQANIGKHFGKTPGQIAGIFSRDRVMFPKRSERIDRLEAEIADALFESIKEDEKPKRRSANTVRKIFHEVFTASEILPKPKEVAKTYDQSRLPGYPLWELDKRGCKFPLLDTAKGETQMFCGETRYQMKPWCKHHHERVWRAQ